MKSENYLNKMRLNIRLSYVKSFLSSLMFFIPIWYAFETQFVSPAELGTIYAISHILTVLLELPTGALADLIGRRKTIILAALFIGGGWIYIAYSQNGLWLWVGYMVNALGSALLSGADVALDFDSLKELDKEDEFAEFKSKVGLLFRLGMVISTFLGGYLYQIDTKLPYTLVGILVLIAGILTFWQTEPKIDSEKFSLANYIKQTKIGIKQITKNAYIKDLSIYYVAVAGISWYFIYFLTQAYITEVGYGDLARSYIYSGVFLAMAIVSYLIVKAKKVTREVVYIMFPAMISIGMIPAYFAGPVLAIFLLFLNHLAGTLRFSLLDQYTNKEFDSKYRATAVSALNMAVSLVFAVITIVGGRVISYFGNNGAKTLMSMLGVLTLIVSIPTTRVLLIKHNGRK